MTASTKDIHHTVKDQYIQDKLRSQLRHQRRSLTQEEQCSHAERIVEFIIDSHFYRDAQHIALYLPTDGEIDLSILIALIQEHGKCCYLPVILSQQKAHMSFAPYLPDSQLKKNCFGISEPVYQDKQLKSALQLDLVLAPLVGFDLWGNRMGMGGGYYDRALQEKRQDSNTAPLYVGIAHKLQQVERIETHCWDVSLDAIVNESGITLFTEPDLQTDRSQSTEHKTKN